jgi:hypothetical protein
MGTTTSKPEYLIHGTSSMESADELLYYMNDINIAFNKYNINNNDLMYMLCTIDNDTIARYSNIIITSFETLINTESQEILNQLNYVLFDHYNMPLLKLINTNVSDYENPQRIHYAKFKI